MTLVETVNLTKTYQMGAVEVNAINEINLKIERGQFVVILGPSGSGKTTLLNLIGAMDTPTSGAVIFEGKEIPDEIDAQVSHRRTNIGFIFQFFNLLPTLTATENVEMALELSGVSEADGVRAFDKKAICKRAIELLSKVGLSERVDHFPAELSGGEQQRVSIARALAKDPPLIVADEPTGSLDYQTGVEILKGLLRLKDEEGKSVLVVTHNREIAKIADRVIELHDGRLGNDTLQQQPANPESLRW